MSRDRRSQQIDGMRAADLSERLLLFERWRHLLGQTVGLGGMDGCTDHMMRIPIVPRYLANDGITLKDVAVAGAGLTLLPLFEVGPEIRDGRLIRLLDSWEVGSVPVHAVYPDNKNIASKVRRFVDFLVKTLPKDAFG